MPNSFEQTIGLLSVLTAVVAGVAFFVATTGNHPGAAAGAAAVIFTLQVAVWAVLALRV